MPFSDELAHLIRHDEPLAPYTWLGIGGPARYFAVPNTPEELCAITKEAYQQGLSLKLLGDGSNILVRESGFDGLVIHTSGPALGTLEIKENRLLAGSGAQLSHAITAATGAGLGGLERLAGVPGTVGGAVAGNASAGGTEIGASVSSVCCVDKDGTRLDLQRTQIAFGHRKSDLAGRVLLKVEFELEPADPAELTKRLQKNWIVRRASRPVESRSIALPFVDPHGADAASLIEQVGLKGTRHGNASLDTKHPSFLIAHEGATSDDCLALIESVREQVSRQLAIDLQLNLVIW